VVASFRLELESDSGLLQQICQGMEKESGTRLHVDMGISEGMGSGQESLLQVSMSAEANFPVAPKWILMNLPCEAEEEALQPGCISLPSPHERIWLAHHYYYEEIFFLKQQLTKREELSFLTVLAFPKASSSGLALMI